MVLGARQSKASPGGSPSDETQARESGAVRGGAGGVRIGRGRPPAAWLVTYADLMTILVCFFVLIISYSIQDQVKMEVVAGSIREAFGVAEERRYAGEVKFKGAPDQRQPGNVKPSVNPTGEALTETLTAAPQRGAEGLRASVDQGAAARRPFIAAKERLENAILQHPILRDASEAITINLTEEGFQVLLVDTVGRPMFAPGAVEPTAEAVGLLEETARAIRPLANRITIEAHADALGSGEYSAFDLTADRANAARRAMTNAGFPSSRIAGVVGRGEANPLYPEDPFAPGNRRIEIVLEPVAPLLPEGGPL